jgi:selenocysteine-specific elongation factor
MEAIRSDPLQTPSPADISNHFGSNILAYLKDQEMVIQVSDQVLFEKEQFDKMVGILTEGLRSRGSMKVTEVKELIPASRKYILAFLEYLDRRGITQRNEDVRTLKKA